MYQEPQNLLTHLHDDLAPFVKDQRGSLAIASDPLNFLELLGEAPSGWRCVLLWAGDQNTGPEGVPTAINRNEFHVGVTCNRGLSAAHGAAITKKRAGGTPSLLELVKLVRERVRSCVFPEGTSVNPIYLACDPATMPDGVPVQGYRLKFSIVSVDEPVTPRG